MIGPVVVLGDCFVSERYGETLESGGLESPAAERNKQPILEVLEPRLPASGTVLEIASGTGQHVVHFARALPRLSWQPSDFDADLLAAASARIAAASLDNVRSPLVLDVCSDVWPLRSVDAVVCINMIHIAPWAATIGLMRGASRVLRAGGPLFLYGPYRREGRHTAPSNEAFDAALRARDPAWGVRDLDDVVACARPHGFELAETLTLPANNLTLVFLRSVDAAPDAKEPTS
jgi:SAM-dependent methyltransferase